MWRRVLDDTRKYLPARESIGCRKDLVGGRGHEWTVLSRGWIPGEEAGDSNPLTSATIHLLGPS